MRKDLIFVFILGVFLIGFASAFVTENSQTYNTTSFETAYENFKVNVTYNATQFSSISCSLIYGGTTYSSSNTGSGNNGICSYSVDVPLFSSGGYGRVNLTGEFFTGSTDGNQTIQTGGGNKDQLFQSFIIGVVGNNSDYNITKISIYALQVGADTGVRIYTSNSTDDAVTALGSEESIAATSPQKWVNVSFTTQAQVSAGQQYGVLIRVSSGTPVTTLAYNTNAASYTGGLIRVHDVTSGAWSTVSGDILFRVYGEANGKEVVWQFSGTNATATYYKNTSTIVQGVSLINMSLCSPSLTNQYVNFSFKNETTNAESVTATFSSTFNYYLGSGNIYKTLSYSSAVENSSYKFCFFPPSRPMTSSVTATYSNSYSQQRGYTATLSLTNSTTAKILYLLPTILGQYTTFQIINPAEQAISGATVTISYGGNVIESKTTDSSGGATFFLNPLTTYSVQVTASGYDSVTSSITPTQTLYTIQLGGSSNVTQNDYSRGITYSIKPTLGTELLNDTVYNFNVTLASSYWSLDSFGFRLYNETATLNSTSSTSSLGGTLNVYSSTYKSDPISMNIYWVINGTYSNVTVNWIVLDQSGTSWSLKTIFVDLGLYLNSGIYGLDSSFGMPLIVFLIIFIFTGVFTYQYGLTSPASIMLIATGLVAIFDYGFGLIPTPVNAVPHIATIFMVLMSVAAMFWELNK